MCGISIRTSETFWVKFTKSLRVGALWKVTFVSVWKKSRYYWCEILKKIIELDYSINFEY